jgi:outer membrane protein
MMARNWARRSGAGTAVQGGADFALSGSAYFNLDVKNINIKTDVKSGATKAYDLKINPLLIGVGVGIRL